MNLVIKLISDPYLPRACRDCRHKMGGETPTLWSCGAVKAIDLVSGDEVTMLRCSAMREPKAICGSEGDLWELKPS